MFEAFEPPTLSARLRALTVIPLGAFLLVQMYFTLAPLLTRVPAWLFWTADFVALAGAAAGLGGALRLTLRHRAEVRGLAIAWLMTAVGASIFCARTFLGLTFPWL